MGSEQNKNPTLKVLVIGGEEKILEKIFPIKSKNDIFKEESEELNIPYTNRKYIQKIDKLNIEVIWDAFQIENMTDANFDRCLKLISKMIDLPEDEDEEANDKEENKINVTANKSIYDRKYIIIKFGTQNLEYLLNMLSDHSRVFLPQIGIVTDEEIDEEYSGILDDNRFMTKIEEQKQNTKITASNIFSYLWDRENYYNERGNDLNDYSPTKIANIDEDINSFINILVVGISRAGKSTLINLLSRKLVSLESPEDKSITRKINEYILERKIDDKEKKIGIKIIDTPGLKKVKQEGKTIDFTKTVIKLIEKKMKECEDSKDDIHMIYFVFANGANLEDHIEFFQFLQKKNKERLEKNKKKIPIIFIGNKNIGKEGVEALRKFLKENNLNELLDSYEIKKEKIDYKKYGKKFKKNNTPNSSLKDNIIEVNLLSNRTNSNIYGIDILLKTTLNILRKNNPFNNFSKLEEMNENIQKYIMKLKNDISFTDEEEKNFTQCKEKIKNLMLEISEENFLLNQIKNADDILIKSRKKTTKFFVGFMISGFAAGLIPFPFVDLGILYPLYAIMIIKIGNCYSFNFKEIPTKDFVKLVFGIDTKISKVKEDKSSNIALNASEKSVEAVRVVGNSIGLKMGDEFGSNLAKNIGLKEVEHLAAGHVRFVDGPGKHIFEKAMEKVVAKDSSKFSSLIERLIQFFPSMKQGVENGVKKTAEDLGNKIGETYLKNTVDFTGEYLEKMCKEKSVEYTAKVASEANQYLKSFCKFIPVIGSIVGGSLDCLGTYMVGKNAIKYFEDYITRTLGCDYVIKQKKTYDKIFHYLEEASKKKYENFEINQICYNEMN